MTGWHLDKRVPISLILAIILQSLAAVWFASAMQSRVGYLEERVAAMSDQRDRIIRLEAGQENQTRILERIERKLDAASP